MRVDARGRVPVEAQPVHRAHDRHYDEDGGQADQRREDVGVGVWRTGGLVEAFPALPDTITHVCVGKADTSLLVV